MQQKRAEIKDSPKRAMKIKDTQCNYTWNVIARTFVGLVFLFSSFVKGVDPMGTAFKMEEYMGAWSGSLISFEWFVQFAKPLAMVLITCEFLVGVLMLTGAFRRLGAWLLAAMMLFFTCTTAMDAFSATYGINDCGCFGDAVKLTPLQTFLKNIVLDVPTVWIVLTRNVRRKNRFERDFIIFLSAIVVMMLFCLYNVMHEPCIDFRAWKVGNQMVEKDANAEVKSYLTYRNTKTGETEEFPSEELMQRAADPNFENEWEWVSSRVEDPTEIKAAGFSMLSIDGEDRAYDFIGSEDYLLIATIHHLNRMEEKGIEALHAAVHVAEENNLQMVIVSAALPEEMQTFLHEEELDYIEFYFADATAIETMARSNPAFVLMKDGKVMGKWHQRDIDGLQGYNF